MEKLFLQELFPLKENSKKNKEVIVVVAITGKWHGHDAGSFEITSADLQNMKANFDAQKTELVIDYEHQTLYGGEAPASGWICELIIEGEELHAKVKWTDKAKAHIQAGEYKYLSPVYAFNSRDPKTDAYIGIKLHSAALTNTPFIDELGEVRANKQPKEKQMADKTTKDPETDSSTDATAEENIRLKEELATTKVEAAITANKLTADKKEWALKYCKQDPEGFGEFISLQKEVKQAPENNMFANKQTSQENNEPDVIAMALNN